MLRKTFVEGSILILEFTLEGENIEISSVIMKSKLVRDGSSENYISVKTHRLIVLGFWIKMWHWAMLS